MASPNESDGMASLLEEFEKMKEACAMLFDAFEARGIKAPIDVRKLPKLIPRGGRSGSPSQIDEDVVDEPPLSEISSSKDDIQCAHQVFDETPEPICYRKGRGSDAHQVFDEMPSPTVSLNEDQGMLVELPDACGQQTATEVVLECGFDLDEMPHGVADDLEITEKAELGVLVELGSSNGKAYKMLDQLGIKEEEVITDAHMVFDDMPTPQSELSSLITTESQVIVDPISLIIDSFCALTLEESVIFAPSNDLMTAWKTKLQLEQAMFSQNLRIVWLSYFGYKGIGGWSKEVGTSSVGYVFDPGGVCGYRKLKGCLYLDAQESRGVFSFGWNTCLENSDGYSGMLHRKLTNSALRVRNLGQHIVNADFQILMKEANAHGYGASDYGELSIVISARATKFANDKLLHKPFSHRGTAELKDVLNDKGIWDRKFIGESSLFCCAIAYFMESCCVLGPIDLPQVSYWNYTILVFDPQGSFYHSNYDTN